ncbi:MAG: pilus assembly protein [Candidatus Schekmanbacteria bacterium]|nr:pilus assembly protein [Candidatus Schekmanbacteria bacterium]
MENIFQIFRQQKGQALTEMILAAPLIALLIFGVLDLGRMINTYMVILDASREGAKFATQAIDPQQPLDPQITAIGNQTRQRILGSIYAATGGEDFNGNGVFDYSEDLNANGVAEEGDIDGTGGWESGGELDFNHNGMVDAPPAGDFRALNLQDTAAGGPFHISFSNLAAGTDALHLRRAITVTVEYHYRLEYLGPALAFFMRPLGSFFPPAWINGANNITIPLIARATMKGL